MNCPVADACRTGDLNDECCNTSNTNQSDCKQAIAEIISKFDTNQAAAQAAAQAAQAQRLANLQKQLANLQKQLSTGDYLTKIRLNLQILDLQNQIDPNSSNTNFTDTLNTIKSLIPNPVPEILKSFNDLLIKRQRLYLSRDSLTRTIQILLDKFTENVQSYPQEDFQFK